MQERRPTFKRTKAPTGVSLGVFPTKARLEIDRQLAAAGWVVHEKSQVNLLAGRGEAVCELSFAACEPHCTLFVDGRAIGTIEAKPAGFSLIGVEEQSTKYVTGAPARLPAWHNPLRFCYESTGQESRFTNGEQETAPDQIRTLLAAFRDHAVPEMFPSRTDLPKTLIFAKGDACANDIVRLCREVFGKGKDFCKKITYKTTGASPKFLIAAFRKSSHLRIAVNVDLLSHEDHRIQQFCL